VILQHLPAPPRSPAQTRISRFSANRPELAAISLAYNWIARRRLFYWYAQLKALEASFDGPIDKHLSEKQAEIERIEEAVSHIRFPLTFSDQLYNLRSHIEIVRRKITSHVNAPGRVAAE
jgi:hypothetical protein